MDYDGMQNIIKRINNDELLHYASDYYDPEKAHEYHLQKHMKILTKMSMIKPNRNILRLRKLVKRNLKKERLYEIRF